MENDKLVITKDNYKGYIELYKTRTHLRKEENNIRKKVINKIGVSFIVLLIVMLITNILGLLSDIVAFISFSAFLATEVSFVFKFMKEIDCYYKKKDNGVKEKYPYVDIEFSTNQILKSLEKVKIISYNAKDELKFNVKEYEDYLKIEEVKKEYLEETKYDGYVVSPKIQKEELEKPKIKKLVR